VDPRLIVDRGEDTMATLTYAKWHFEQASMIEKERGSDQALAHAYAGLAELAEALEERLLAIERKLDVSAPQQRRVADGAPVLPPPPDW
jgi:hypothetical protein